MIRPARAGDIPAIHAMIRELAEYERGLDEVTATEDDLARALLAERPALFAHVAEDAAGAAGAGGEAGGIAGIALWFVNYSTWTGHHGIYLEDLYVRPSRRGRGHGRALLAELARICTERGYQRLEWSVLDWNEPARRFYASLGAVPMDEWTVNRLAGPDLDALAASARQPVR